MALIITAAIAALFKSAEVDAAKADTSSKSVIDTLVAEGWTAADLDKPKSGEVIGSSYYNLHSAIALARTFRAGVTKADPLSVPELFYLVADRKASTIEALFSTVRKANPDIFITKGKKPVAKHADSQLQAIRTREQMQIGLRIQYYRAALIEREGAALAEALKIKGQAEGKSDKEIEAEVAAEAEKKWEKQFVAALASWEKKFKGAIDAKFVPLAAVVEQCRKDCEARLNPPKATKARTVRKAK